MTSWNRSAGGRQPCLSFVEGLSVPSLLLILRDVRILLFPPHAEQCTLGAHLVQLLVLVTQLLLQPTTLPRSRPYQRKLCKKRCIHHAR